MSNEITSDDVKAMDHEQWQQMFARDRIRWARFTTHALRVVAEIAAAHCDRDLAKRAQAAHRRRVSA